jgi:hypothetical protein
MNLRYVRLAIALAVIGYLFFYFVPVIPVGAMFSCNGGATVCLSNPSGFISLAYSLFHSGGVYSFEGGYFTPAIPVIIGGVTSWLTLGWFEVYLFIPIGCVLVGLLSPEIVDGIQVVSLYLAELVGRDGPRNHKAS